MAEQSYVTLNDGSRIPQFGLGVFMVPEGPETVNAVKDALGMGIRHIDTAHAYQNERSVGEGVRESGVPRNEIWITSKLWPSEYGEEASYEGVRKMLGRLGTDYVDLVLLHQQVGDTMGAWRGLEKAKKEGLVRSIGISNFDGPRLDKILSESEIKPSVIQVECHPYWQQTALKKKIAPYGIRIESWYPIGHGDKGLIEEPLFTELGKKYGKSNVQIILRWHIQEGNIVFPKTTNPKHMKDNFDIFDFELTDAEMAEIRKMEGRKKFYNATYEGLVRNFTSWSPAD
ncbi:aldo/keto reductase [Methanomassiliicoccales archaeon LGM-DZ1]|nr:aldo/keto reductase [Methanomassiliicoccales archaeon LGM-DZ1]